MDVHSVKFNKLLLASCMHAGRGGGGNLFGIEIQIILNTINTTSLPPYRKHGTLGRKNENEKVLPTINEYLTDKVDKRIIILVLVGEIITKSTTPVEESCMLEMCRICYC